MRKNLWLTGLFAAAALSACKRPDGSLFSDGGRVGHVQKFSYKEMYDNQINRNCGKNWEGELAMAGSQFSVTANENTAQVNGGNIFAFSVPKNRNDIVEQLRLAQMTLHPVSLHYFQVVAKNDCYARTDYFIIGVDDLTVTDPKVAADLERMRQQTEQATQNGVLRGFPASGPAPQ